LACTVALVAPDALNVIVQEYGPGFRPDVFTPALAVNGEVPLPELSVSQPHPLPSELFTDKPLGVLLTEMGCDPGAVPPISYENESVDRAVVIVGWVTLRRACTVTLGAPAALKVIAQEYGPAVRPVVFTPALALKGVFPPFGVSVSQPHPLPSELVTATPLAGFVLPTEIDCNPDADPPI